MVRVEKRRKTSICLVIGLLIAALTGAILFLPAFRYPVSLAVMKVYSGIHEKDSIMAKKGIPLEIPGGRITDEKDWYPFVMTFNDTPGFRSFLREQEAERSPGAAASGGPADYSDLELTILYNFPAFDLLQGCSRLYDPESPYYSSFYGAYLVSGQVRDGSGIRHPYGFLADGSLDAASTAQVPQFDFQKLVLGDMGIQNSRLQFRWELTETEENADFAGSTGWSRADAVLEVNGLWHEKKEFHQSYLQYGTPGYEKKTGQEDFAVVRLQGRIYGKYLKEYDTAVFFYVLAKDRDVVEKCSEEILGRSRL